MAVMVRTRRLANPSRLKRRRAKNPKRMTLKQKLFFGSARQRAAARLRLKSKRRNPQGMGGAKWKNSIRATKKRLKARKQYDALTANSIGILRKKRKARKKNVGEIVSISLAGLGNPGRIKNRARRRHVNEFGERRKNTGMAKRRRRARKVNAGGYRRRSRTMRASNPAKRIRRTRRAVSHRRRTRRNPGTYVMRRINRGRRRRNPSFGGLTSGVLGQTLGVIGGAVGSKYITQLALGGNNTGLMGYAGNLAASIGLGWAVGKFSKNSSFGTAVLAGGLAALTLRVLSDNTPIGQYVNLSLSGMGKGGDTGIGIIQDSSFPVPQVAQPGSMTSFITPRATRNYVGGAISAAQAQTAQMSAAGSKGMGIIRPNMGRQRRAIM